MQVLNPDPTQLCNGCTAVPQSVSASHHHHACWMCCCRYPDFTMTDSGLQYKDLREGTGETPQAGDVLVVDWWVAFEVVEADVFRRLSLQPGCAQS